MLIGTSKPHFLLLHDTAQSIKHSTCHTVTKIKFSGSSVGYNSAKIVQQHKTFKFNACSNW